MRVRVNQKTNFYCMHAVTSTNDVTFSPVSVCVFVWLFFCYQNYSKTTDKIFMKFYGMVGHNPGSNQFDFGGNQDLDPDPGVFWGNFTIALFATVRKNAG